MRNPSLLIFANAIILIAAFAMLSQFLFVVPLAAVTTRVDGQVVLQHGGHGNFVTLSSGSPVTMGDVLRSDEKASAEFTWADDAFLKMKPSTEVSVRKLDRNNRQKVRSSLFFLKNGEISIHLSHPPTANSRLQIETPTALATAHSTDFTVKVLNGQTQVSVEKGSVEVESHGGKRHTHRIVTASQTVTSCFPGEVEELQRPDNKAADAALLAGRGTAGHVESVLVD